MKDHGQLARASENFARPVDFETPRPYWPVQFLTSPPIIFLIIIVIIFFKCISQRGDIDDAREITKMSKKLNFVAAILDFGRPSWIDNGDFLTLYSIHGNDYLYQFS